MGINDAGELALYTDLFNSTYQNILSDKPPLATFAYRKYQFFNMFFQSAKKEVGGDELEGHITLDSEGNARLAGIWEQDTLQKKNIHSKFTLPWRQAKGGMLWNTMETTLNSGKFKIFNLIDSQYDSAIKDIIEAVYITLLTGPTSASDDLSPYSVCAWLPFGTAASTGGWTGYSGHYNDGNGASAATFDRGGLSSSASTRANWAGYYADHAGEIDETLLEILDRAVRKLNFQAPIVPKSLGVDPMNLSFSMYTSDNVISKLNTFYAQSDDNMGYNRDSHWGTPTFRSIPFAYCDILDTARTSIYGTDPIIGLNHSEIYPVIHQDWNFKELDGRDPNRMHVLQKIIWLRYQIWCKNPKEAGFLISQHPSS